MEKICTGCLVKKSLEQFNKHPGGKFGRTSRCKNCVKKYRKEYYKKNPNYFKEWRRKNTEKSYAYNIKKRHGITWEEYQQLYHQQNGLCAICNKPEQLQDKNGKVKRLALDHCHKTNKVRALLCNGCNRALGYIHDDVQTAKLIVEFLERHE